MPAYDLQIGDSIGVFCAPGPLVLLETGPDAAIGGIFFRIAARLRDELGRCAAVDTAPAGALPDPGETLRIVSRRIGRPLEDVTFVGFSCGALAGAQRGWTVPAIRRMLFVNAPLMQGWHETRLGIERFRGERAHFLCGTRDPSWQYFGILEHIHSPVCSFSSIEGADHRFSGMQRRLADAVIGFVNEVQREESI